MLEPSWTITGVARLAAMGAKQVILRAAAGAGGAAGPVVAQAVRSLVADEALCETLGCAGLQRVESRFRMDHMVENTLAAYQSL